MDKYKMINNKIVCVEKDDQILFTPSVAIDVAFDDSIPWQVNGEVFYRLNDGSFVPNTNILVLKNEKTIKLDLLEEKYQKRVKSAYICSCGWPMQFDRSDTLAVEGAIQLLRATGQTTGYLTDANDTTHYDVPLTTMEAVKVEMLAAYAQCHARKQELRALINAAQTEKELDAIEITWPV